MVCQQLTIRSRIGLSLLVDFVVAISIMCAVLVVPLELFSLLPLKGAAALAWGAGAVLGGLAAVPLTRFARRRYPL